MLLSRERIRKQSKRRCCCCSTCASSSSSSSHLWVIFVLGILMASSPLSTIWVHSSKHPPRQRLRSFSRHSHRNALYSSTAFGWVPLRRAATQRTPQRAATLFWQTNNHVVATTYRRKHDQTSGNWQNVPSLSTLASVAPHGSSSQLQEEEEEEDYLPPFLEDYDLPPPHNNEDEIPFVPSSYDDEFPSLDAYDSYVDEQSTSSAWDDQYDPDYDNDNNDSDHELRQNITSEIILQNLNEAQVQAVTTSPSSITRVLAGPGSGKTRVLTCRIANLLQQRPRHENILAVTFTKKAAMEMNQRVEKLLESVEQAKHEHFQKHQLDEPQQSTLALDQSLSEDGSVMATPHGAAVGRELRRVTLGTFHSVCAKIMRWNADYLSTLYSVQKHAPMRSSSSTDDPENTSGVVVGTLDSNFAIADSTEQVRILKEILKEMNIKEADLGIRIFAILNAISSCKEDYAKGVDPFTKNNNNKNGKKPSPLMQVTAKVYNIYRERLFASNHVDFDDLIYLTEELLSQHDDIRERMQKRWTHVLVDEFQDTSTSQLKLVKLLSKDSLFVVGDGDQSIFSWRGAHASMMHDFCDQFDNVETVYLMENYRSTTNIVKAAQKVINAGDSKSVEAKLRKDMKPKREAGVAPRVLACSDDKEEAEHVIKSIKKAVDDGTYAMNHGVALIYRTNAQSRALEEACVKHNLPYVIFGSATSFYQRREIKDCLCFMRWLANGRDRGSMLRAFVTPTKGIGGKAQGEFDEYCRVVTGFYETHLPSETPPTPLEILLSFSDDSFLEDECPRPEDHFSTRPRKMFAAFSEQMLSIYNLALTSPVEKVLAHVVDTLELQPHFNKISKSTAEFEERKANVKELQSASQRYTVHGPCLGRGSNSSTVDENGDLQLQTPLAEFLEDVALVTDMAEATKKQAEEQERFVVKLMTIHGSKGLEFDTVYVVGNEDGTFPTSQAIEEGEGSIQLEEERRLCYVAMTRARHELIMTWRKEVPVFTTGGLRWVKRKRSRFLDILTGNAKNKGPALKSAKNGQQRPPEKRMGQRGIHTAAHRTVGTASTTSSASLLDRRRRTASSTRPETPTSPRRSPNNHRELKRTPNQSHVARPNNSVGASKPSDQKVRQKTPAKSAKTVDSTWFFPVGSSVVHKNFGPGTVLPPPTDSSIDMPVRVKFSTGVEQIFSAREKDISPIAQK